MCSPQNSGPVLKQIKRHYDHVGGYGHILIMGQAGFLEHDNTVHRSACSLGRSIYGARAAGGD